MVKAAGKKAAATKGGSSFSSHSAEKPPPKKKKSKSLKHNCVELKQIKLKKVEKHLHTHPPDQCQVCGYTDNREESSSDSTPPPGVWVCLTCGHVGCGRTAKGHAIDHFESSKHPVSLNTGTWECWCYVADNEVKDGPKKGLTQLEELRGIVYWALLDPNASKESKKLRGGSTIGAKKTLGGKGVPGVKGLTNLGNTCFFNSIMQNFVQTKPLRVYFSDTLNKNEKGLTAALRLFMRDMWLPNGVNYSPRRQFNEICKRASRFRGYRQQDAQELLRYLLDGVRAEERTRLKLDKPEKPKKKKKSSKKGEEEEEKEEEEANGADTFVVPTSTFVDDIFGGWLVSTIICEHCKRTSRTHEPFYDLSLPIPSAARGREYIKEQDKFEKTMASFSGSVKLLQARAKKRASSGGDMMSSSSRDDTVGASQMAIKPNSSTHSASSLIFGGGDSSCSASLLTLSMADDEEEEEAKESEKDVKESANGKNSGDKKDEDANKKPGRRKKSTDAKRKGGGWGCCRKPQAPPRAAATETEEEETSSAIEDVLPSPVKAELKHKPQPVYTGDAEVSVMTCLQEFTRIEFLTDDNMFGCSHCTRARDRKLEKEGKKPKKKSVLRHATKQYLIRKTPVIMTLHLKRFQVTARGSRKLSKRVSFPLVLDVGSFLTSNADPASVGGASVKTDSKKDSKGRKGASYYSESAYSPPEDSNELECRYALFGVCVHSGGMGGGHYTAYVRKATDRDQDPEDGAWYYFSDTTVEEVSVERVLEAEAYLLFYERIKS